MCVCVYVCRVCVYNSLYFFFSFFFYQFVFTYHAKNLLATSSLEHLSLGVYIHIYLSTKQSRYATIRTPVVFFFYIFSIPSVKHWTEEFAGACETRENREFLYRRMTMVRFERREEPSFVPQG